MIPLNVHNTARIAARRSPISTESVYNILIPRPTGNRVAFGQHGQPLSALRRMNRLTPVDVKQAMALRKNVDPWQ